MIAIYVDITNSCHSVKWHIVCMTWCVEMKKIQNQCKKYGVIFFS
jgi:hypothetical protein